MGVLGESLCFCKGVGKSERMKAAIFSGKGPAIAGISVSGNATSSGTGFLTHRNLLLTTHGNVPSVSAAEECVIRLQNGVAARLVPHRFFITSSVLDLTIVGLDSMEGDSNSQQPPYLKTSSKPNLDLGSVVYILGHTEKKELTVNEGRVVITTDNLIKLSTNGVTWSPGSAGFDPQGILAFIVCDPMKLAASPNTKSSSTSSSSSSWKKDIPMQFGIPIPIIYDWLNQHWEGSLDELNKPKLPIIRLMSVGPRSEHSCTSFTLRQVFKPAEETNDDLRTPSSSNGVKKIIEEEIRRNDLNQSHANHVQGIPTPEIYESPKLTSVPLRKRETAQIQLLDINFPTRVSTTTVLPHQHSPVRAEAHHVAEAEVASTSSINGAQSEVQSNSSPVQAMEMHQNGYSSEGETMYSAETAESRNYTSPKVEGTFQQVGRSHSCGSYSRWGPVHRNPVARREMLEKQRSFIHGRKVNYSQGGGGSQRSNDYFSPTVSSIMKRNGLEQPIRPRQSAVHSSPRWMF